MLLLLVPRGSNQDMRHPSSKQILDTTAHSTPKLALQWGFVEISFDCVWTFIISSGPHWRFGCLSPMISHIIISCIFKTFHREWSLLNGGFLFVNSACFSIFSVSVISYFGWMVLAWAMKSIVGAPKVFCLNAECAWHSCSAFAVAVLEI